jgi:putative glutamine amidotransferase
VTGDVAGSPPLPLIGITGRRYRLALVRGADRRYGDRCTDSAMSDFATGVARAGGLPVHLSFDTDPDEVCRWLAGVVITGGQDVHPARYGGDTGVVGGVDPRTDPNAHDPARDAYEVALVGAAIARGIPILGVCRGMQVLNVALGGTLVADLPPGPVNHLSEHAAPTDGSVDHVVTFAQGSVAGGLFGDQAVTNSWHHQAVARCGDGLTVTGRTSDGVIEAIELATGSVLGVQWHPEWTETPDPTLGWIVRTAAMQLAERHLDQLEGSVR